MKTYDELKAMTTEDLVRYAMELQDSVEKAKTEKEQITCAISSISQLA